MAPTARAWARPLRGVAEPTVSTAKGGRRRGPSAAWTAPGTDQRDRHEQGLEGVDVVSVGGRGGRDGNHQRHHGGIGQHDRPDWDRSANPFFARTAAASTIAEVQSSCPRAPSSSSTAWCSLGHNPARVQAVNRRCAVGADTPNSAGRCRHAHPLVSTYTIAVNTARSSTGPVPPPCRRGRNCGTNGATRPHNSSGTNRNARSDATTTIMQQATPQPHETTLSPTARPRSTQLLPFLYPGETEGLW